MSKPKKCRKSFKDRLPVRLKAAYVLMLLAIFWWVPLLSCVREAWIEAVYEFKESAHAFYEGEVFPIWRKAWAVLKTGKMQ